MSSTNAASMTYYLFRYFFSRITNYFSFARFPISVGLPYVSLLIIQNYSSFFIDMYLKEGLDLNSMAPIVAYILSVLTILVPPFLLAFTSTMGRKDKAISFLFVFLRTISLWSILATLMDIYPLSESVGTLLKLNEVKLFMFPYIKSNNSELIFITNNAVFLLFYCWIAFLSCIESSKYSWLMTLVLIMYVYLLLLIAFDVNFFTESYQCVSIPMFIQNCEDQKVKLIIASVFMFSLIENLIVLLVKTVVMLRVNINRLFDDDDNHSSEEAKPILCTG